MFRVLLLLAIVAAASAGPTCGENEVWNECAPACDRTCENRLAMNPGGPSCQKSCVKKCDCKYGFILRGKDSKCVKPADCGPVNLS